MIAILPNIEQSPLFAAYNFSGPGGRLSASAGLENTTVTYTQIATFLCPSENEPTRPGPRRHDELRRQLRRPRPDRGLQRHDRPGRRPQRHRLAGAGPGRPGDPRGDPRRPDQHRAVQRAAPRPPGEPDGPPGHRPTASGGSSPAPTPAAGRAPAPPGPVTFVQACKSLPASATLDQLGPPRQQRLRHLPLARRAWSTTTTSARPTASPARTPSRRRAGSSLRRARAARPRRRATTPAASTSAMADGSVRFVKDSVAPQRLVGASAPATAARSSTPPTYSIGLGGRAGRLARGRAVLVSIPPVRPPIRHWTTDLPRDPPHATSRSPCSRGLFLGLHLAGCGGASIPSPARAAPSPARPPGPPTR